jgi:hypothetical protein
MENKLNTNSADQIETYRPDSGTTEYNASSHNMLLVQVVFEFNKQTKKFPSFLA